MSKNYDFSGWATRNDLRCSDGRIIHRDAFKDNDGQKVPLVWNHQHNDSNNVLGHALLKNMDEGVYAYCSLNDSEAGKNARILIQHGDVSALSIYANQLKQQGSNVIHGAIREVSLVLAGANPGAFIDSIIMHGEESDEEAIICSGEEITLSHADNSSEEKKEEEPKMAEQTKAPEKKQESDETVADVFNTLTEKQKTVVYALIGEALSEKENNEEDANMKHNAFEADEAEQTTVLSHSDMEAIFTDAKRMGSLKDATLEHGITNIDYLFPEVQTVNKTPEMISRDMDWVTKVMNSVHHTPFSRVKSTAANITADEARAKGYVKGNQKVEEVITALKRTTTPTTIYKLQKLDRDDVIDITDFDVVSWIKSEMRVMLNEELARAILIGDGRSSASNDKINPLNIRPILGDSSTYTVAKTLERSTSDDEYTFAKKFIKNVIKARKDYKGSGNPSLFTTEDMLTNMLLIEDTNGRVIYDTIEKLTTALRVKEIVTVPVFDNVVRTDADSTYDYTLMGMLVNLTDYNVGADKGGSVNMFDDFDINYNKYEYLIETRCSGALTKPFSAITFEEKTTHTSAA